MIGPTTPMRRPLLTLAAALSLSVVTVMHAADDLVLARFGEYLESLRTQAGIPALAATIVGPAEVQWERSFGQSNVERSVATRTDTLFHLDAMTQLFTATMVLRCVEEGRLSLEDRIGTHLTSAPDPNATLRQLLSNTSGTTDNLVFSYRPDRFAALGSAVTSCYGGESYRAALATWFEQRGMMDSVPGPDVVAAPPPGMSGSTIDRYRNLLARLATPYSVDAQGRASPSRYVASTLTPVGGVVSTVIDMAKFDLALKRGQLLRTATLNSAWTAPTNRSGQALPHGLGWFVQSYAAEPVVWQFGVGDNGSSSMLVTLPRRGLTLILLANSDGLAKPFALASGDLTVSPFGKLFLGIFVR
jgi:CubicO group peptidase (beta-lactamase class C family)